MAEPSEGDVINVIHVELTHSPLSIEHATSQVRSPKAGAIVIFAGTTRDNFGGKPVKQLEYSAYCKMALKSMQAIAERMAGKHGLLGIAVMHRLGVVPIGEESILIVVAAPHREAAWLAGEETLEEVKKKVEIWKLEEFGGEEGGIWRANRDGAAGARITDST